MNAATGILGSEKMFDKVNSGSNRYSLAGEKDCV